MNVNKKRLLVCLAIPLATGGAASLISGGGMHAFELLTKPPLSPPGWLFPVAWTLLYLAMGAASYLVVDANAHARAAIILYGLQLICNFLWPILFFGLAAHWLALICLIALWLLILAAAVAFYRIRPAAGRLMLPYLAWTGFAAYLNLGVCLLN